MKKWLVHLVWRTILLTFIGLDSLELDGTGTKVTNSYYRALQAGNG